MLITPPQRILLGISGGIAAYKSADLVRRLREQGAEVRVVMTAAATEFITPMTLQALSGHPVRSALFDPAHEAAMGHIELARWPDQILIAPASADLIARLSLGLADDLLTTLCLASRAPLALAPAMNSQMWAAAPTQEHLTRLRERGVRLLGPDSGRLACGEEGAGRMLDPQAIAAALFDAHDTGADAALAGVRLTLTAGPTREALDPVRYISNHSSGRMGYAIAAAAARAGARVRLVSGPTQLAPPMGVEFVPVESAEEMLTAVLADPGELFIAAAAVADYRPLHAAQTKIKKGAEQLQIELVRNPDILATVSALPAAARPFCVGFAAETDDLERHARDKLARKGLDMVAANWVGAHADGGGFNSAHNALELFWEGGSASLPMTDKATLANQLLTHIVARRATSTANR